MIITKNGKSRSIRTFDEFELLLLKRLETMDADEQVSFQGAMKEIAELMSRGKSVTAKEADLIINKWLAKVRYKDGCVPVSPRRFLMDDEYMGKVGKTLYPKLIDDFIEDRKSVV